MYKGNIITKRLVSAVDKASKAALESWAYGRVSQEPQITDRLLAHIEAEINHRRIGGISWYAKTLSDRGRNSEESRFGADFLGAFSVTTPELNIKKGFLAQAKRVEPGDHWSSTDHDTLRYQCEKMLSVTSEAFLFLYSKSQGITIVSAESVISCSRCNPHLLTAKSVRQFFTDHFECFVGDRRVGIESFSQLASMQKELNVRSVLLIQGGGEETA